MQIVNLFEHLQVTSKDWVKVFKLVEGNKGFDGLYIWLLIGLGLIFGLLIGLLVGLFGNKLLLGLISGLLGLLYLIFGLIFVFGLGKRIRFVIVGW